MTTIQTRSAIMNAAAQPKSALLPATCFLLGMAAAAPLQSQMNQAPDSSILNSLELRSIGPVNMGGRTTDIEALPNNAKVFYVATATGGIWKTINGGTTFFPLFQNERVISMGDIAIAPSNPDIIWAGTGEEDSRNSASPGGGVFKSTDGGVTWTSMGLEKTEHIGRIVIHPDNPDIVYVAALGAMWRSNPERGLYKTTNGGDTWELIKFVSDRAGFVDIAMDPRNPNVLYASSWERIRKPYALESGGPGSALWKSTNAGRSWTEIRGRGFPETMKGRISLAIAASNPNIVYAQVEADSIRGARPQRLLSGLYRSTDAGRSWTWMSTENYRPFYFSQIRVDPLNPNRVYRLAQQFHFSDDGGASWRSGGLGLHEDTHALWIDPRDPEHYLLGGDAGIHETWDKGGTYNLLNNMPLAQFYNVSFDYAVPYRVCGGMQDNGTSCGPSRKRGGVQMTDWFALAAADGFHTQQDPRDPNIIYYETQGGNMSRRDLSSGQGSGLRPRTVQIGTYGRQITQILQQADSSLSSEQQARIAEIQTTMRAQLSDPSIATRWNWNTPFFLSPHNPDVFYSGAEKVFKSTARGERAVAISPDLSARDPVHLRRSTGYDENGYPAPDVSGGITNDVVWLAELNTTIVSLAESPVVAGLLFAGTGDGKVWVTRDDGGEWEDLTGRFPGVPAFAHVSRIEPSAYDTSVVYVSFDNHAEGDFAPYLYRSDDMGRTFTSIVNDLPTEGPAFVRVIREDPANRNLLYVGTDVGLWVSLNGGSNWNRVRSGLPTVPVYDLKVHPRDHELIIGTHGRGIWIMDVNPLQQMADSAQAIGAFLFRPATAYQYAEVPAGSEHRGNRPWSGDAGPYGVVISFYSNAELDDPVSLAVTRAGGDTVAVLTAAVEAGINRAVWNFNQGAGGGGGRGRGGGGGRGGRGGRGGAADSVFPGVPPGINPRPAESQAAPDSSDFPGRAAAAAGRGGRGAAAVADTSTDSTAVAGRGGRGGGGGGRGGAAGGGGAGGRGGAAGGGRAGGAGGRGAGGGGRGGGGRGGAAADPGAPSGLAPTGDYAVHLTINGREFVQRFRIERLGLADPTLSIGYEGPR